jgi:hypothetical protein
MMDRTSRLEGNECVDEKGRFSMRIEIKPDKLKWGKETRRDD